MVTIPKCRSKKHNQWGGGCGDPRCPEGMHHETVFKNAIEAGAFDEFFDSAARDRLVPFYVQDPSISSQGFFEVMAKDPTAENVVTVRVAPNRPALRAAIEQTDRTTLRDFNSLEELHEYAQNTFGDEVSFHATIEEAAPQWNRPWTTLGVMTSVVAPDLRGLGISRHLKQLLCRFADRHGYFIDGTPTNLGDGSTTGDRVEDKPRHREQALRHRERLVRAYYRNGYVDNPCWSGVGQTDWLTGEYQVHDQVTIQHFTETAQNFLRDQGQYIRFPNGRVPRGMLKAGKTFDAKGYRNPRGTLDEEEAYELNHQSWVAQQAEYETDQAALAAKRTAAKAKRTAN